MGPSFELAGVTAVLDCTGAMWLPDDRVLVVSDLHFEKGSHFAERGQFLPPYDTTATLETLERLVESYRPETVISLGDAFHDTRAEARMQEHDAQRLEGLTAKSEWIWILGNHDPLPPARFRGDARERCDVAGLRFSHEPGDHDAWQVAGHLHPCAVAQKNGRGVRRKAFVTDGQRMIMPAMGAFTGGLNVLDDAYQGLLGAPLQVHLCGQEKVYQVPLASLRGDTPPPAWLR